MEGWVVTLVDAGRRTIVIQPVSEPTKIPGLPFSGRGSSPRDKRLVISNPEHWDLVSRMVSEYQAFFFEGDELLPASMTPSGKVVPLEDSPSGWSKEELEEKLGRLTSIALERKLGATTADQRKRWQIIHDELRGARTQAKVMQAYFLFEHESSRAELPTVAL